MCLGLLSCCACKCAESIAEAGCSVCGKVLPFSLTRVLYVLNFLFLSFLSWILGTFIPPTDLNRLSQFRECDGAANSRSCYINMMVSRFMLVLVFWHLIHAVLVFGVTSTEDLRAQFHNGWWMPRLLVLAIGVVAVMWLPNPFFVFWGWVTLIGACVFILIQIILLIDFVCEWAHQWVINMEEEADGDGASTEEGGCCGCPGGTCNRWYTLLLSTTLLMYIGGVTISVLLYVFFTRQPSPGACPKAAINATFISINLVLGFLTSILSVLPKIRERKPDSGLLQSSLVFLYTSYLIFSALVSEPDSWLNGCNSVLTPHRNTGSGTSGQQAVIWIGAIITILAVCWSSFRNGSTSGDKLGLSTPLTSDEASSSAAPAEGSVTYSYTAFHVLFLLGAMYVQQLLTNWQTISEPESSIASGPANLISVDSGLVSVWFKVVTSWLVYLLYIWQMIAPTLFPDRDFGNGVQSPG